MADLKAAAKFCRASSCDSFITDEQTDFLVFAAQALEAWAWIEKTGAIVRKTSGGEFWCAVRLPDQQLTNNYYADTPLGAVLAAMEGERYGRD